MKDIFSSTKLDTGQEINKWMLVEEMNHQFLRLSLIHLYNLYLIHIFIL